jgi:hypothetical protein
VTQGLGNTDPTKVDIDEFDIVIRSNGKVRADYCDFSGVTVKNHQTDVINFYMEEDRRANVPMEIYFEGIEETVSDSCRKYIKYLLQTKDGSGNWQTVFDAQDYGGDTMWDYEGDGTNLTDPTHAQSALVAHGIYPDVIRSQPWIGEEPVYIVGNGEQSWFSMYYKDDELEGL